MSSISALVSLKLKLEFKDIIMEDVSLLSSEAQSQISAGFQEEKQESELFRLNQELSKLSPFLFTFRRDSPAPNYLTLCIHRHSGGSVRVSSDFAKIEISSLKIPFLDWIPLSSREGIPVYRLLLKISYLIQKDPEMATTMASEVITEKVPNKSEAPKENKEEPSEPENETIDMFKDYSSRLYIFGDDGLPIIMEFDYKTEKFIRYDAPPSLQLFGYMMATPIPNGKIIFTGGINKGLNIINPNCLWYDPILRKTAILHDMNQARYTHSVIYKEGFLYAIGGRYYGPKEQGVLSKCERYNIKRNLWEVIADMKKKRCTSVVYEIKNCLYVFGGYEGKNRLSCIEQYNEESDTWTEISLQLFDGVEAGVGYTISDYQALYIGGIADNRKISCVTVYDLQTNSYEIKNNIMTQRVLSRYGKYKNFIYVFGGGENTWEKLDTETWKWSGGKFGYHDFANHSMKTFSQAAPIEYQEPENSTPATASNNVVLFKTSPNSNTIMPFDSKSKSWKELTPPENFELNTEIKACLIESNGYILLCGGINDKTKKISKYTFIYDPVENMIHRATAMPLGKKNHSLIFFKGFVYCMGGKTLGELPTNNCERFCFLTNKWQEVQPLQRKKYEIALQVILDEIYAFGGFAHEKGPLLLEVEKYDPINDNWKLLECKIPTDFVKGEITLMRASAKRGPIYLFGSEFVEVIEFNPIAQTFSQIIDLRVSPKNRNYVCGNNLISFEEGNGKYTMRIYDADRIKESHRIESIFEKQDFNFTEAIVCNMLDVVTNLGYSDKIIFNEDKDRNAEMVVFAESKGSLSIFTFNCKTENFYEVIGSNIHEQEGMKNLTKFSAVALPDGRILLSGGIEASESGVVSVVNWAFIYALHSKTFKKVNTMNECRFQHCCTVYGNIVIVFGGRRFFGRSIDGVTQSVEKYSLRDDKWEILESIPVGVSNASATSVVPGLIFIFGGNAGESPVSVIQKYSIVENKWDLLTVSLPEPLEALSAITVSHNKIFLLGGVNKLAQTVNNVLAFETFSHKIEPLKPMLHNRAAPKVCSYCNKIFVFGGSALHSSEYSILPTVEHRNLDWRTFPSYENIIFSNISESAFAFVQMNMNPLKPQHVLDELYYNKVYIFPSSTGDKIMYLNLDDLSWGSKPIPSNVKFWDHSNAITLRGGTVFISGGINRGLTDISNSAYLLKVDRTSGDLTGEILPNMIQSRYTHNSCFMNNFIYVLGGRYFGSGVNGVLAKCERLSIKTLTWEQIAPMNDRRCTANVVTFNNKIYIIGGYKGDGRCKGIERYNELHNEWERVPQLLVTPIEAAGIQHLSNKEFILIGGKDDFKEQPFVQYFDLERGIFGKESNLLAERILCKSARYKNKIFVLGGNKDKSCECAEIGEWKWKHIPSYEQVLGESDDAALLRHTFAQSF